MFGNVKFRWFLLAPIVLTLLIVSSPVSWAINYDEAIKDEGFMRKGIVVVPSKPGNSLADFFEQVSNNIVLIEAK